MPLNLSNYRLDYKDHAYNRRILTAIRNTSADWMRHTAEQMDDLLAKLEKQSSSDAARLEIKLPVRTVGPSSTQVHPRALHTALVLTFTFFLHCFMVIVASLLNNFVLQPSSLIDLYF